MSNSFAHNASFSEQILQAGFDMRGLHLIEASAGTGKTYSLQTIFLRLLLEQKIPVQQIVVVTFTTAAAKDLKNKLRQVLQNALHITQNPNAKEYKDYGRISAILNLLDNRAEASKILQTALLDFDLAAIHTIHAFCHRLLNRYAFHAGLSLSNPEVTTSHERIVQLCRDWIRMHQYPGTSNYHKPLNASFTYKNLCELSRSLVQKNNLEMDLIDPGLRQAALEVKKSYEEAARFNEVLSFDDLLANLYRALIEPNIGPTLCQSIRNEFKAALIDEFQDTDPLQWKIFEHLFVRPEQDRPCFIVGDPKQAIYAFRNGDVYTYLEASSKVDNNKRHQLKRNYRSEKAFIAAINKIFADDGNKRTFLHEQITYAGNLEAEGVKPEKALTINGEIDPQPIKWITMDEESLAAQVNEINQAGEQTALEILHLLQDETISIAGERPEPGQIAVLCRTNDECDTVLQALNRLDIPCVRLKGKSVWQSEEAVNFLELIFAVARPFNRNHIFAFMLNPWGALKREQLLTWQDDQEAAQLPYADQACRLLEDKPASANGLTYAQILNLFDSLGDIWLKYGFSSCCQRALQALDLPARMLQETQGEQKLANLKQIIELTQQKLSEQRLGIEELLTWLQQSIIGSEETDESSAARKANDNPAVQVLTIHASKGLEFPIVFVPNMHRMPSAASRNLIEAHDNRAKLQAGIKPPSGEEDASFEQLQMQYGNELHQEYRRLTYVALTRAIHRCSILYDGKDGKNCDDFLPARAALASSPLHSICSDWRQNLDDFSWQANPIDALQPPPERPALKPKNTISSFSAFAPSVQALNLPALQEQENNADNDPPEITEHDSPDESESADIFAFPAGERTGNCWHEIFEKLAFDAGEKQIKLQVQTSLQNYGFAGGKHGEERLQAVCDMVHNTLNCQLPALHNSATFALKDLNMKNCIREWEFFFSAKPELKGQALQEVIRKDAEHRSFIDDLPERNWNRSLIEGAMTGYVDLWFEHQGRYYILDWKSNRIRGNMQSFTTPELHDEISRRRYWLQYLFYCVALNGFLQENLQGYSYEKNFGGIYYLFLRGVDQAGQRGVYACRPTFSLIQELSEMLIK